jgi:hypothetical protein
MLATIEDSHALNDLNSAKTTDIEQVQDFLVKTNSDRRQAVQAMQRLQKKLADLKSNSKGSIFNDIVLSDYVAEMI